jgi:hypothetical protein
MVQSRTPKLGTAAMTRVVRRRVGNAQKRKYLSPVAPSNA